MLLIGLVTFILAQHKTDSARILGIFHERSFSHQILGTKLLFELASRGHEVTMLTPVLPKINLVNFTAIELNLENQGTDAVPDLFDSTNVPIWNRILDVDEIGLLWSNTVLKDRNVQLLLKSNHTYDIVIMEQLANHALKGFCYHYKAICVMLSTMGPTWLTDEQMGNFYNPAYKPDMFVDYPPTMNFYERLHNAFVVFIQKLYFYTYTIHKHNQMMQKYFPGAPHITDILYNTSLMLLNSHLSTSNIASNLPNVIEIGGFHIDPPTPLPKDIETFLNGSRSGAIYFSMGSILKMQNMDKVKLHAIINAFRQLPQKVLWKLEDTIVSELPSNVMVVKWAPQLDVLAHPNVRLFITHGGLLSTTEAIARGVPILGISVFADQGINSALAQLFGYGIAMPYNSLTEDKFVKALHELLNNPMYLKNAKQRSRIFHDQPMTPLDRAVYWIEYVIRYKGAPHLRTAALNLTWYQYLLLDVLIFAFLLIGVIALILGIMINLICRRKVKTQIDRSKKLQ